MTRTIVLTLAVVLAMGAIAGSTFSKFSSTTDDSGNSYGAGTVLLGDNDAGAAMLNLTNANPGDSDTSCIQILSTGTLDSTVRLYGTVTGSLGSYLTLTVTRGTSTGAFDSCTGFTADSTNYTGNGAGVVYSGSLASFPSSYSAGIVDPTTSAPETWSTNESHWYRFVISLNNNPAAQGLTASASFTWEARNL